MGQPMSRRSRFWALVFPDKEDALNVGTVGHVRSRHHPLNSMPSAVPRAKAPNLPQHDALRV